MGRGFESHRGHLESAVMSWSTTSCRTSLLLFPHINPHMWHYFRVFFSNDSLSNGDILMYDNASDLMGYFPIIGVAITCLYLDSSVAHLSRLAMIRMRLSKFLQSFRWRLNLKWNSSRKPCKLSLEKWPHSSFTHSRMFSRCLVSIVIPAKKEMFLYFLIIILL